MNNTRIPSSEELPNGLRDATQDELVALAEFAAWADTHHMVLANGRKHGIRIGVTSEVAEFVRRSMLSPAAGEFIAGNLVQLQG
jgi:hypothetical protein